LGYAITSHKAQGATISIKVVIKVRNSFAQGLTYVMLSWVTNRKYLFIYDKLTPNDFDPMV
jgi:ATP-dependent DNA helicase PIF1